jgi:hypothetical protein
MAWSLGFLRWLLLVPYFAVASLNAPAGIGGNRRETNRTNAQLLLALILLQPVIALSPKGLVHGMPKWQLMVLAGLLLLPTWQWVSYWLSGEREADYRRRYKLLSWGQRAAVTMGTVALSVAVWILSPD